MEQFFSVTLHNRMPPELCKYRMTRIIQNYLNNPLFRLTGNMTVYLPASLVDKVKLDASQAGETLSAYVQQILEQQIN